jgi:hypothetical protein
MTLMKLATLRRIISGLLLQSLLAMNAVAQCEDKTGFAKKACEVESGNGPSGEQAPPPSPASKNEPLSTNFSDTIHLDTLSPDVEPKAFRPLNKLSRTDDGAFILTAGIFEAYVQSFSLDAGDRGVGRVAGFYPAPIKGRRARFIADVLKQAELHPDVPQPDIQYLLAIILSGVDLENMPPPAQQTATRVMSKEALQQLQGAVAAKAMEKTLLNMLNQRMAKDPKLQQQIARNQEKQREFNQQFGGMADAAKDMQALTPVTSQFSGAGIVLRGT